MASTGELNRTGDGNTCGVKRNHLAEHVTYYAAHGRVRALRGSASTHRCVDCGRQAKHWSYDHEDPNEAISRTWPAMNAAYSMDPDRYHPRCVPCHKRFDLDKLHSTATLIDTFNR